MQGTIFLKSWRLISCLSAPMFSANTALSLSVVSTLIWEPLVADMMKLIRSSTSTLVAVSVTSTRMSLVDTPRVEKILAEVRQC